MFYAHGYDKGASVKRIEIWERISERRGRRVEPLANKPTLPDEVVYIWSIYLDVRRGCEKLSFQELDAYQKLTGADLTPFEVDALMTIDAQR